ncbi:hypothetical protein BDA96_07G127100 [Sorghum bicolor]|uniref:Uncharacterized protein n=2 Tax=Sorghum bicolor TaxID=4558 RepID=A0A921UAC7_SORBI|nr:hypothetical protein BDA96_07G127100 [Sorghum bicolor]KXG25088.1 hypothetical protein SORBI_3007G118100 [Sorghum bicolor]
MCELFFLAAGSPVPDLTLTRALRLLADGARSRLLAFSPSAGGDGGCFPEPADRAVDLVGLVAVRSSCRASPRLRAAAGGAYGARSG